MKDSIKIIQIATSSDGRVIALGDNGRAYWYYSVKNPNGDILENGWKLYPELPSVQPTTKKPNIKK